MSIDVFISYSRVDQPFVVELDAFLSRAGVSAWFDKKSLLPGKKWQNAIEDQIEAASVFLSCLSQAGLDKKGYFHVEQNIAVQAALRRPPEKLYIMPVTLGECSIPRQFRQYNVANLAEPGAIDMLLVALSEALERQINADENDRSRLRTKLLEHAEVEGESNKEFATRLLEDDTSFETAAGLIQRIANSSDGRRLALLLRLRNEPNISYAEQRALDIAIDNVKEGKSTDNLQARAVAAEREKISQMGVPGSPQLTTILQLNKYARFTARKNSPVYEMAEAKILELTVNGIFDDSNH
jgi:hypothetical protein